MTNEVKKEIVSDWIQTCDKIDLKQDVLHLNQCAHTTIVTHNISKTSQLGLKVLPNVQYSYKYYKQSSTR